MTQANAEGFITTKHVRIVHPPARTLGYSIWRFGSNDNASCKREELPSLSQAPPFSSDPWDGL